MTIFVNEIYAREVCYRPSHEPTPVTFQLQLLRNLLSIYFTFYEIYFYFIDSIHFSLIINIYKFIDASILHMKVY
jgi:hypothetical protein